MTTLHIETLEGPGPAERPVEIVERKGLGHPDTICDQVAEHVSMALVRAYRERFGTILHHNCDKALLAAGRVERRFGGGRVAEPMSIILGGRATARLGDREIDVRGIAADAARDWLREQLREVDPERHVDLRVEIRPGSQQLTGIFGDHGAGGVLAANDTSAASGWAPLSPTEEIVLAAERTLNGEEFKRRFPETGEDVKVMGVRTGREVDLTVAVPLLDRFLEDEPDYFRRKERIAGALRASLAERIASFDTVRLHLNVLDREGRGLDGLYASVLGTSAEDADDGQVGRGNRANGLIALYRPGGMEAVAGKNPVSHVGKIYGVLAHVIARRLQEGVPGVRQATVRLASRIGEPVDRPAVVAVSIRPDGRDRVPDLESAVRDAVETELARVPAFCEELASGLWPVC